MCFAEDCVPQAFCQVGYTSENTVRLRTESSVVVVGAPGPEC